MNLKQRLSVLISAIITEAEKNEPFRTSIERALGIKTASCGLQPQAKESKNPRGGRRTPATFDPVELVRLGEGALREKLHQLSLEQLRDIVAQYGMDPGKLVMKWKDSNRVIDRIVELAMARATKGDAFRGD